MDRPRLGTMQALLKNLGIDALIIRSTDKYFNEYVPKTFSPRVQLTGFDGSMGDAIITPQQGHLFVDGRYKIQAKNQAEDFIIHVSDNNQSIEECLISFLQGNLTKGKVVSIDPKVFSLNLYNRLEELVNYKKCHIHFNAQDIYKELLGDYESNYKVKPVIWSVDKQISGQEGPNKLKKISQFLQHQGVDGFLAVKLDDIAYLTNLRSNFFPFQSSLPGIAAVLNNKIILGIRRELLEVFPQCEQHIQLISEDELLEKVPFVDENSVIGIDKTACSKAQEQALKNQGIKLKYIDNPVSILKAVKNDKELLHMRSSFQKADKVVYKTHEFIFKQQNAGEDLTEGKICEFVKEAFKESGAKALSFNPICASGENGAIIHYGTPDYQTKIEEGSLFLLDCGAYYEGGYATDLTRTFFVAKEGVKPKDWQKELFTLVLKSSIAGLSARFRKGVTGQQLDAIMRAPIWQAGYDYAHGSGHGVGINVHEFPPRIAPNSQTILEKNQVFSIEPGLYFEGMGGVRIENLATIIEDKNPNFLRILPLTFCPLDERLIEIGMLDKFELRFLEYYKEQWQKDKAWPDPPPNITPAFSKLIK